MALEDCPSNPLSDTCTTDDTHSQMIKGVLYSLTISHCEAGLLGGGVCLWFPNEGFFFRNSELAGCCAVCAGGAVALGADSGYGASAPFFEHVYLSHNSAAAKHGHDILLNARYAGPFTVESGPFEKETCATDTPSRPGRAEFYAIVGEEKADEQWLAKESQGTPQSGEGGEGGGGGEEGKGGGEGEGEGMEPKPESEGPLMQADSSGGDGLSSGAVVGVVVGFSSVVGVGVAVAVLVLLWKTHSFCFATKVESIQEMDAT